MCVGSQEVYGLKRGSAFQGPRWKGRPASLWETCLGSGRAEHSGNVGGTNSDYGNAVEFRMQLTNRSVASPFPRLISCFSQGFTLHFLSEDKASEFAGTSA